MRWTEREDEVLRKLYPNPDISREEFLKVFPGRSWYSIEQHGYALGVKRGRYGEVDEKYLKQLIKGKDIELV